MRGRRTVTAAPPTAASPMETVPPIASTMRRTIESPRPEPGSVRVAFEAAVRLEHQRAVLDRHARTGVGDRRARCRGRVGRFEDDPHRRAAVAVAVVDGLLQHAPHLLAGTLDEAVARPAHRGRAAGPVLRRRRTERAMAAMSGLVAADGADEVHRRRRLQVLEHPRQVPLGARLALLSGDLVGPGLDRAASAEWAPNAVPAVRSWFEKMWHRPGVDVEDAEQGAFVQQREADGRVDDRSTAFRPGPRSGPARATPPPCRPRPRRSAPWRRGRPGWPER